MLHQLLCWYRSFLVFFASFMDTECVCEHATHIETKMVCMSSVPKVLYALVLHPCNDHAGAVSSVSQLNFVAASVDTNKIEGNEHPFICHRWTDVTCFIIVVIIIITRSFSKRNVGHTVPSPPKYSLYANCAVFKICHLGE